MHSVRARTHASALSLIHVHVQAHSMSICHASHQLLKLPHARSHSHRGRVKPMAAEFDFDKLMAAAQEAVSNPAAAAKTSTESLLVNPAAAAPAPAPKPPLAPAPLAEAAPAPKPPLAPAPKWPLDAAPKTPPHEVPPPWRATPSSATAAKTRPRGPATVPDPRVATIGNKYKLIGGQWQQVQSDRPISSAEKAGVVFPAVPPAVRPVAPSKSGGVARNC